MAHSLEAAQLHEDLNEAKDKSAELHDVVTATAKREINNVKAENDKLQSKIVKLRAKLQDQKDSINLKKTYDIYHMKRKTLEEAKEGVENIDDCISKARELETTTLENLCYNPYPHVLVHAIY
ncbi:tropomyosin-2-like [Nicotiana sylvestris]|uniref:tropomyosin-2-like n=1 Tax=Nicotiana sylvestris TaxID=4096 RepID=UPI00388CBE51